MSIRGFADRWPFRRKLNLLVGVPLAVVAVLLAYLISDEVGQSTDASDAAQLVRDSGQVAKLVNLVEAEHQQAILLSVRFEATNDGGTPRRAPTARPSWPWTSRSRRCATPSATDCRTARPRP